MNSPAWLKALALSCALLPTAVSALALPQHFTDVELAEPTNLDGLPGGRKNHPARREQREYVRQNVLPVVRQQRQKLEAQLSATDKAQLETYRGQLRELRQRGQALRRSFRPEDLPRGQRPELTDAQRQQLTQLHSERRAVLLNVAQLAQLYDAQISQLKAEVQPQHDKWAADLRAIAQKHATPGQEQRPQWKTRQQRAKQHGLKNFFGPARFLLLNPNAPAPAAGSETAGRAALYPNPAVSTQRLDYQVAKAGNVKVELLDERGKTLRTVFEGRQEPGAHGLDLNVAELTRGTYYYKITSKGNAETRRFVKE